MSDRDLRTLERRYHEEGETALPRLNAARLRAGLDIIRGRIVHYLKAHYWHRLNERGEIDLRVERGHVWSACGSVALWPRRHTKRKAHYTPDKGCVTCKTCQRHLEAKGFKETATKYHLEWREPGVSLCGGRLGRMTQVKEEVGCRGCRRLLKGEPRTTKVHKLNARGRRRLRRQQQFPLKYGFPPVGAT